MFVIKKLFFPILMLLLPMASTIPTAAKGITTLTISDSTISVKANLESSFLLTVTDVNQRSMDIFFEDLSGAGIEFRGNSDNFINVPNGSTVVQTVFVPEAASPGQYIIRAIGLPSDLVDDIVAQFEGFPSIDQLPAMGYRYDDLTLDVTEIAAGAPPAGPTLAGITISGPQFVNAGGNAGFSATATYSDNSSNTVTDSAAWSANSEYASINPHGILNASEVSSDVKLTLRANFTDGDTTRSSENLITILAGDLPEETILYFPQFISGAGASTEFILVNNCNDAKTGSIVFYSNDSSGTATGEIIKIELFSIESRDVLLYPWSDGINNALQVGAVVIIQEGTTTCNVEGTEFFNALDSYTTVPAAQLIDSQQIFALRSSSRDTGFAVYNPNDFDVDINVSYFANEYSLATSFSLGPHGHKACYLGELFRDQIAMIPDNIPGTLNFSSDGGENFALMGLYSPDIAGNALVSLPISPNAYEE